MKQESITSAMALANVFNYKCALGRKLIEVCGDPQEVFRTGEKGIKEMMPEQGKIVDAIFDSKLLRWAEEEIRWAGTYGVKLLFYDDERYPQRLLECDDAPLLLYCMGEADLNAERMLSVVGTRKATFYGKSVCRSIVSALGENPKAPTIVSGLAFGIDGEAHRAALDAKIPTVAVLPTGLDCIYPTAHRDLAKLIIQSGGALVTDFSRNTQPSLNQFVRRNRIIAGMADATLLVESFAKGGGLITTQLANSYNREVFAVPGRTVDPSFDGCNKLIETNLAKLATGASSIERSMGWKLAPNRKKNIPEMEFEDDPMKKSIVKLLREYSPMRFNAILEMARKPDKSTFSSQEVSTVLLELELEGRLGNNGGDLYELLR